MLLDFESLGDFQAGVAAAGGKINVKNAAAIIAIKVAVLLHVGAVTGGGAFQINVPDEVAFDQCIEAIINRGHGYVRHPLFGADKHILDGGMVAFMEQN